MKLKLPRKIGEVSMTSCCKLKLPATLSSTVVTCAGTIVVFVISMLSFRPSLQHYFRGAIQDLLAYLLPCFGEPCLIDD